MSEPDFQSLLSVQAENVERPRPLPAGHYDVMVKKFEFGKSQQKQTPYIRFFLEVLSAGDDVDPSALEGMTVQGKELRTDFYLLPTSMFRLVDFLQAIGCNTIGRELKDVIPETVGMTAKAQVTQRKSDKADDDRLFNDIKSFVKA